MEASLHDTTATPHSDVKKGLVNITVLLLVNTNTNQLEYALLVVKLLRFLVNSNIF